MAAAATTVAAVTVATVAAAATTVASATTTMTISAAMAVLDVAGYGAICSVQIGRAQHWSVDPIPQRHDENDTVHVRHPPRRKKTGARPLHDNFQSVENSI
jgi:hypothetical protein